MVSNQRGTGSEVTHEEERDAVFAPAASALLRGHGQTQEPTVDAEWSHSFSEDYPFLDGSWNGIVAASDGNTYFAVCTHSPDHHAQFFRYDPRERSVKHVADIGEVCGELGKGLTPQGKVHTPILEYKNKLYMATLQARYKEEDEKRYPGGHFLECDLRTGKFRDLGIPYPGKSYFTLAADLPRPSSMASPGPGRPERATATVSAST